MYLYIYIYICTLIYVCVHVYIHVYIYIHIYICIYIHTVYDCICMLSQSCSICFIPGVWFLMNFPDHGSVVALAPWSCLSICTQGRVGDVSLNLPANQLAKKVVYTFDIVIFILYIYIHLYTYTCILIWYVYIHSFIAIM